MSEHKCSAFKLQIEPHPNADRLEIARGMGAYTCIGGKDLYKSGQIAVYIPEQSIVPEKILRAHDLWNEDEGKGMLAGSAGNRVKSMKLRGILSQGLVYVPDDIDIVCDRDYADELDITKYEPPI